MSTETGSQEYGTLAVTEIIKETEKAILVRIATDETYWFPLSQISQIDHATPGTVQENGTVATITIKAWLLKQKGLI